MLTRVGLKVNIDAMTQSTFFAKRNKREFGFWLSGWGSDTGEMSSPLKSLLATPNKDKGMGPTNSVGYSNPKLDAVLAKALATVDDAKRADTRTPRGRAHVTFPPTPLGGGGSTPGAGVGGEGRGLRGHREPLARLATLATLSPLRGGEGKKEADARLPVTPSRPECEPGE